MLWVQSTEDLPQWGIKKGDRFPFYVVDAHHHMGRENTHQNTPPRAYEFYSLLWFELQKMASEMHDADALRFLPVEVGPVESVGRVFNIRDHWHNNSHGWLVDRTIVFPYTDDYCKHGFPENASFHVSNDRIFRWTTQAPHSLRLIGFARIDPLDDENGRPGLAVGELERAILTLGLRGLKLHPLAQLFVDQLDQPVVRGVVRRAGELGIPTLFDSRNIATVERISEMVQTIQEEQSISSRWPRVILGHCGMSPGSPRLYEFLSHPLIFGETSTLHGKDVPLLFESARDNIHDPAHRWSEKLIFGTDYSFLSVQAADVILYLLSRDFPGDPSDIQRILAGNALSLVGRPFAPAARSRKRPRQFLLSESVSGLSVEIIQRAAETADALGWRLASLDFMRPPDGTWVSPDSFASGENGVYRDSCVMSLQRDGVLVHLWLRPQPGGGYCIGVVYVGRKHRVVTTESYAHGANESLSALLNASSMLLFSIDDLMLEIRRALS